MTQYKEYPNIRIPRLLDDDKWQDSSWHNDLTASSMMYIGDYELIVYVSPKKAEREFPEQPKYFVVVLDSNGNMLHEIWAKNIHCLKYAIKSAKADIQKLMKG